MARLSACQDADPQGSSQVIDARRQYYVAPQRQLLIDPAHRRSVRRHEDLPEALADRSHDGLSWMKILSTPRKLQLESNNPGLPFESARERYDCLKAETPTRFSGNFQVKPCTCFLVRGMWR